MSELLATPAQIGVIVLRTVVVYAFVLIGFRISGKREVGQLAPYDFALILLIANAVQNAMVGPDTSLLGGLAAAAVLLVLNYGLRVHVYQEALDSEHVTHQDLMQTLRAHGCCTIADCRLAVLEVDGSISVVAESSKAA